MKEGYPLVRRVPFMTDLWEIYVRKKLLKGYCGQLLYSKRKIPTGSIIR